MILGIYRIINVINKKLYIGSALNVKKRWREHKSVLRRNLHHNCHLQRSWLNYGKESFKFEIIEYCEKAKLLEREQFYLDFYNSANPEFGYNINPTAGSNLGKTISLEAKQKMSLAKKGKPSNHKGYVVTEETKKKISAAKMGRTPNRMYGPVSEEARKKMSESKRLPHKIEDGVEYKFCTGCNLWLPLTKFCKDSVKWDKLVRRCRDCLNAYYRNRKILRRGTTYQTVKRTK